MAPPKKLKAVPLQCSTRNQQKHPLYWVSCIRAGLDQLSKCKSNVQRERHTLHLMKYSVYTCSQQVAAHALFRNTILKKLTEFSNQGYSWAVEFLEDFKKIHPSCLPAV